MNEWIVTCILLLLQSLLLIPMLNTYDFLFSLSPSLHCTHSLFVLYTQFYANQLHHECAKSLVSLNSHFFIALMKCSCNENIFKSFVLSLLLGFVSHLFSLSKFIRFLSSVEKFYAIFVVISFTIKNL